MVKKKIKWFDLIAHRWYKFLLLFLHLSWLSIQIIVCNMESFQNELSMIPISIGNFDSNLYVLYFFSCFASIILGIFTLQILLLYALYKWIGKDFKDDQFKE